jgi:anaerobic magnesium-protoporphyrin IX monomethyl ester cyclase
MKKILLINPPLYFSNGKPKSLDVSTPPLGVLFLASYINKYSDQFKAEIIDIGAEKMTLEQIGKKIKEIDPFVISLSSMTPQLQGAVELAGYIKQVLKSKAKIFLGGPHISADKDFINRHHDLFDYAITGEGEKTFLESLDKLVANEPISMIQNGEVVMDLDQIPIPDRNLIKKELYSVASMLFSRGCPFKCYYCSRPSISKMVRYRSAGNVIREIRQYQAEGIKEINFQDDTFTMNHGAVMNLCRQIIREGLEIKWQCNTRIDLVDEGLLRMMKKAGCTQINFGIESGNERLRREIICKGNFTNVDIARVFKLCRKFGIRIACYFIIGHPTETKENILETKKMILSSDINVLGLAIPLPFPGSALYEIAKADGIINEKIIDKFAEKELGEGYAGVYPEYVSKTLDPAFVHQQMREINRKFYLNFKILSQQIRQNISSFSSLKSGAKDLVFLIFRGMSSRKSYIEKSGKKAIQ